MNEESIENLIRGVLKDMNSGEVSDTQTAVKSQSNENSRGKGATVEDYPIAQKHPDWIKTKTGKTLEDITLSNVLNGKVTPDDLKITPNVLKAQGEIATSAGRKTISLNFDRAAELTAVPDDRVLDMYNALRPYRSSKAELLDLASELEEKYDATICASFVREAADQYEKRKKLKGDN